MTKIFTFLICCFWLLTSVLNTQGQESENQQRVKVSSALLVIDIQNDFLPYMSETDKKSAMEIINKTITIFHEKRLPVIRIYHQDLNYGGPQPGSHGFEFPETVCIDNNDPKVIKHYENAFTKTCLDSLLRELGVNTVFLCGLSATGCVLGTYFGSRDHDYFVFIVKDGIISPKTEQTDMIREICSSMNFDSISSMLNRKE